MNDLIIYPYLEVSFVEIYESCFQETTFKSQQIWVFFFFSPLNEVNEWRNLFLVNNFPFYNSLFNTLFQKRASSLAFILFIGHISK